MKTYEVLLPVYGSVSVAVEASDEKEAIQVALDTYTEKDLLEWSAVERLVQGNVCYASPMEAQVDLIEDEE